MLLPQAFYQRPTLKIAQDLLGCLLARRLKDGAIKKFMIVETEAYDGPADKGSHASRGRTPRNAPMFEAGGIAYVYFTYGMHHMLNVVTGPEGYPAAVLIRALEPILDPRSETTSHKLNGPAKLTKALDIDKAFNSQPLYAKKHGLWLESRAQNLALRPRDIVARPRVGIDYAEEYRDKPWRFYLKGNKHVSKP